MSEKHSFQLTETGLLCINGVDDVISFDEEAVVLAVGEREMNIGGRSLLVTKLSLETKEVCIEGQIEALYYSDRKKKKGRLLGIFG